MTEHKAKICAQCAVYEFLPINVKLRMALKAMAMIGIAGALGLALGEAIRQVMKEEKIGEI